jgi:hypothetical protein
MAIIVSRSVAVPDYKAFCRLQRTPLVPSVITRILFLLSSYFPLSLIFFVILFPEHHMVAVSILAVGSIGLIWMLLYLKKAESVSPFQMKIAAFHRRDTEAMPYIVMYIIPFLAIPLHGWKGGIALSIFFVVLGIVYVNSNMIHINPMLSLFGYHLYEVTTEDGGVHSLLAKRSIRHCGGERYMCDLYQRPAS